MRTWFWTILLFTLAVALALLIDRHPGNVVVVVDQVSVQVSLAFAVLTLVFSFVALYVCLRVLIWVTQIPARVRNWRGQRQARRDQDLLEDGWTALIEGRYSVAVDALTKLSKQTKDRRRQVLSGLSAARAAHALGEYAQRDKLIEQAQLILTDQKSDQTLRVAVAAAAADLWLDQGLAQQALDTLLASGAQTAKHVHTMRILLRAYQQLNNHQQVLALAHQLKRMHAIKEQEANRLVDVAAAAQLRDAQRRGDGLAVWKSLRQDEKLLPEVALAGADVFEANEQLSEASKILQASIEHSFDSRVLDAYAKAQGAEVNRRLQKAEAWLVKRPNDPQLLATLGSLCLAAQMWGQAQRYLERSVAINHDPRVHALLGSLFDRIGKPDLAAKQWRMATAVTTALPVLSQDALLPAADLGADPDVKNVGGWVDVSDDALNTDSPQYGVGQSGGSGLDYQPKPAQEDHAYDEYFDSAPPTVPVGTDSDSSLRSSSTTQPKN